MNTIGTSVVGTTLYEPTIEEIKEWRIVEIKELTKDLTSNKAISIKASIKDNISDTSMCHRNSTSIGLTPRYSSYPVKVFLSRDIAEKERRRKIVTQYQSLCDSVLDAETKRSNFVDKYLL